ncbi:hypothetical protein NBZ79_00325 [Sneathiella marina]|uniref:Secreted protein n=1 Tax=Sneathiella marina TaxID=2950108 RepID=A0ABY4W6R1_9PROT|nr:hypothetical protein [Sneathiella marina]USG61420.1 hypothetical protein NBZ79_00325 [Sneathiella marina]
MRLRSKNLLSVLIGLATASSLFMSSESRAEGHVALSEVSGDYATVTDGWYLEQKCNSLSAKEHQELEWQVWRINEWIARFNGVPFVVAAQNHASRAAAAADCNADASKIATDTLTLARSLGGEMTGGEYTHPSSLTRYNMRRFTRAALGIDVIMEVCKHFDMSDARWTEVKTSFDAVAAKLKAENPELMKEAMGLIDAQREKFTENECNARARQMVNGSLFALNGLEKSLK